MKYFRLLADPNATLRWHLRAPVDSLGHTLDASAFTQGSRYAGPTPLMLPLRRSGRRVDFNFCDFDMVVTPSHINVQLERILGNKVQRVPVDIEPSEEKFEILNVLDVVDCIDEDASDVVRWNADNGRPDKVGQIRMVTCLRIDDIAAEGHHLFRIRGWLVALIASEDVKRLLQDARVSGVSFEPVS